jgi:hypothetical protein
LECGSAPGLTPKLLALNALPLPPIVSGGGLLPLGPTVFFPESLGFAGAGAFAAIHFPLLPFRAFAFRRGMCSFHFRDEEPNPAWIEAGLYSVQADMDRPCSPSPSTSS